MCALEAHRRGRGGIIGMRSIAVEVYEVVRGSHDVSVASSLAHDHRRNRLMGQSGL